MSIRRGIKQITAATLAMLCFASMSYSQAAPSKPPATPPNEYLTVNESPDETNISQSNSYDYEIVGDFRDPYPFGWVANSLKRIVVNLLKWTLHEEALPVPEEKYARKLHFGRWINDPADDTCMNTRARVLVRDSETSVTFRGNKQCVVDMGQWADPYTGETLKDSRQIQIDHMVPLKNAYVSGAWKWDYKTRCLYANFMAYPGHLVSAEGRQNMAKGDRGPEAYMPPNMAYRCEYLKHWLSVKMLWRLSLTMDEAQAIHDAVNAAKCDPNMFKFDVEDMKQTRQFIRDNIDFCVAK